MLWLCYIKRKIPFLKEQLYRSQNSRDEWFSFVSRNEKDQQQGKGMFLTAIDDCYLFLTSFELRLFRVLFSV
jgi:hypothetical protein